MKKRNTRAGLMARLDALEGIDLPVTPERVAALGAAIEAAAKGHADDAQAVAAVLDQFPQEAGEAKTIRFLIEVERRRAARLARLAEQPQED